MTLEDNEIELLQENQEEYGLTDTELRKIDNNRSKYDPFGNPKGEPCPDCGDEDCILSLSYIEETAVHSDKHPEKW